MTNVKENEGGQRPTTALNTARHMEDGTAAVAAAITVAAVYFRIVPIAEHRNQTADVPGANLAHTAMPHAKEKHGLRTNWRANLALFQ